MKHFLHILLILFLFILSQIVASVILLVLADVDVTAGDLASALAQLDPAIEGRAILAANVLLIATLWFSRLAGRRIFSAPPTLTPVGTLLSVVGFIVLAHGLECVTTPLGLDDFGTTAQFEAMSHDWLCLLALCLVIPLTEEMVFRGGILRKMLESGSNKWVAIVTTAVAFGLFHGNPLQAIPAMIMGVGLGWLYTKTGSLRLCLLAHIANNTMACIEMQFPQLDAYLEDSPTLSIVVLGVCLAYFGVRLLTTSLKKVDAPTPSPATTE